MHNLVERGLEEYLAGVPNREIASHLAACPGCREDVEGVRRINGLLGSLRNEAPLAPSLGFSSRLVRAVAEERTRSIWSVFSVDPAFARKLAFGSLLSLAVLGSYLATGPDDAAAQADHTPEAVMASHNDWSAAGQGRQDGMLLTLATYEQ